MKSIVHNLGLGDHIICAPIVARLASQHFDERIALPCFEHNLESVRSFYVNFPNIHIVPIKQESELDALPERLLSIGHYSKIGQKPGEDFISWFYRQADFPLEERDYWCPIRRFAEFIKPAYIHTCDPKSTSFIHQDVSRGYAIDEKLIRNYNRFYPGREGTILSYAPHLLNFREIHCIDSSFLHLADALPTTGKLFFHRYARAGEHNKNLALRKKWEILE